MRDITFPTNAITPMKLTTTPKGSDMIKESAVETIGVQVVYVRSVLPPVLCNPWLAGKHLDSSKCRYDVYLRVPSGINE